MREAAAGDTTATIRDIGDAMRAEEQRLLALRTTNADRSQTLASTVTIAGCDDHEDHRVLTLEDPAAVHLASAWRQLQDRVTSP